MLNKAMEMNVQLREVMEFKASDNSGMRTCTVMIFLDKSGSVKPNEEEIFSSVTGLLNELVSKNKTALDMEFKVILAMFNSKVQVINPDFVPLPPEQILELFERNDYKCAGGTSLARVFEKVDELFSRKTSMKDAKKGDPLPIVVYISDYEPTDKADDYDAAKKKLLSNVFYEKTQKLCLYLGSEKKRAAAAELVGGEDHVVVLDADLSESKLLSPVLIGSTLLSTDATHMNTAEEKKADSKSEVVSPKEIAESEKKRAKTGAASAKRQTDQELWKELSDLFKDKAKPKA